MNIDWSFFGIEQGSSVDADTIVQVETLLKVKFPESYLDLVIYADEASPEAASFVYGDTGTCISEFFSFSPDVRPYTVSWYSRAGGVPGLPVRLVPIARDAGGCLICLNFDVHPVAVEAFDPGSKSSCFIASHFDDFVGLWGA
ncbi:SMI1/KNR4 family protein [Pseudomonas purpurea]|uniref:SMI1/KNR4 family protein n=1 Tax=Pseudomonas purpurea TaxID=3136737 RepID=UPI0032652292